MNILDLNERKNKILSIIVEGYIKDASPISSAAIAREYNLGLSPATIRNEMSDLEDLGFITHPHTSAGRIPTDEGYRYYVDKLMSIQSITMEQSALIEREYKKKIKTLEEFIEATSRVLSTITHQASIVTYPKITQLYFKEVNLIPLDATRVLVIWQSTSGFMQDYIIDLREEISRGELVKINNFLNGEFKNTPFTNIIRDVMEKLESKRDSLILIYEKTREIVSSSLRLLESARLRLEGSSYLLDKPEFMDIEKTRSVLHALEDKNEVLNFLQGGSVFKGVNIIIGKENSCRDIWDCSIVTTDYRIQDTAAGFIGILGPKRMPYGSIIGLVNYVSNYLTDFLSR